MKNIRLYIYAVLVLLILLPTLNAAVDTVKVFYDADGNLPGVAEDYDYAIIGRTYDLHVSGIDLQPVESTSELTLSDIFSPQSNLIVYKFTPNNTTGTRTFGEGSNQFQLSVISEADELVDSIGSVIIEINDHSSSVSINNLDLNKKIIRNLNLSKIADMSQIPELEGISGNLDLNQLLTGFTFDLQFVKGSSHPLYHSLQITNSKLIMMVENMITISGFGSTCSVDDINDGNPECLNNVIDFYNADVAYAKNATAVKAGNNFFFSTDEGYANLDGLNLSDNPINVQITEEEILQNIYDILDNNTKYITPSEILTALLPLGNFSNFTEFVDFNKVGINYSNLEVQDGEYTLKVLYEDKYGNQGEMPFTLRLDITNEAVPESENNNTVIFTDIIITQTLDRIENLPSGVNLAAVLYGSNNPGFLNVPSNVDSLNYMTITPNVSISSGSYSLYFKILKNSISSSDKNSVRLYVQEGTGAWVQLSTSLINETATHYEYKGIIPHFSNFLIGVVQPRSSSTGGSSRTEDELFVAPNTDSSTPTSGQNPIDLGGTPEDNKGFFAAITGAVVGVLGTPGGTIFVIIVIVGVVGLMIILRAGRKARERKNRKEKLNNRGDEVDEL